MIDQPLNIYTKQPNPAMPSTGGNVSGMAGAAGLPPMTPPGGANMTFTPIKKKNNTKKFAMIGGVLAFLILAVAGVGIALKTSSGLFAPNAPQSNPGAASASLCTLNFTVAGGPSPSPSVSPSPGVSPSPSASPTLTDCSSGAFDQTFSDNSFSSDFTQIGSGSATVASGVLSMTIPANTASTPANVDNRYALQTTSAYTGDFDVQIDAPSFNTPNQNQGQFRINLDSTPDLSTHKYITLSFEHTTGTQGSIVAESDTITPVVVTTIPYTSQLSFKMSRRGDTVTTYYNVGNGFVQAATYSGYNTPLYIRPALRSDSGVNTSSAAAPLTTGSFDNWILSCPTPTPTPTPTTYTCNSTCDTDSQCQTANADYVCSSAQGNTCRLDTNLSDNTCTPATGTYACNSSCTTNDQCASANSNYICASVDGGNFCRLSTATDQSNCQAPTPTPTPTIGCNQTCVSNSDCASPDQICYSNVCRLQTNPTDMSCAPPTTPVTPTPGVTPQPTLPSQLPSTGPADWGNWLKAGLGVLGAGAALLFLL